MDRASVKAQSSAKSLLKNIYSKLFFFQSVMNATSYEVYNMTGRRAWMSEITVLIPRHWDLTRCPGPNGPRKTTPPRPTTLPDVAVGRNHPVLGNHPWTIQHMGCGQRGHVINLPNDFITTPTRMVEYKGKKIIHFFRKFVILKNH